MPFALLCGLVSVGMITAQGAAVIAGRTRGPMAERARQYGLYAAAGTLVLFALGGVWVSMLDGHVVTSVIDPAAPINPLSKSVELVQGGWLLNYSNYPWMIAAPIIAFAGLAVAVLGFIGRKHVVTLLATSAAIFGIITTAGLSLFPFLLPSSTVPGAGLTLWDASSSHLTLFIMLIVTVFFLPIILAYTTWVFRVMRGPVTADNLTKNPNAY